MMNYLKKTVDVKVPITGIGGFYLSEHAATREFCDFIDNHVYWDHPEFPLKKWDRGNFKIHNKFRFVYMHNN